MMELNTYYFQCVRCCKNYSFQLPPKIWENLNFLREEAGRYEYGTEKGEKARDEYDSERRKYKLFCPKCFEKDYEIPPLGMLFCQPFKTPDARSSVMKHLTCRGCRKNKQIDAKYPKGCSGGKKCRGYLPNDLSMARKVTRKRFQQEEAERKRKGYKTVYR